MSTKLIRRALIASGLFVGALASFSHAAFADPIISGDDVVVTNPVLQSIAFTSTATAGVITLEVGEPLTDRSIGNAVIQSNASAGYTVKVTSTNLGNLKDEDETYSIPYTLGVTGSTVDSPDIKAADATVDSPGFLSTCANSTGCSRPLAISIGATAMNGKPSGDYSDTLTFSILNK